MIPNRQFGRKVADLGPQGLARCLGSTDAGLPALAPTARCPFRVQKQTIRPVGSMSAVSPRTDVVSQIGDVRKVPLTEAVRRHSTTVLARAMTVTGVSLISVASRSSIASTTRREKGPRCAYAAIRATAIRAEDGSLLAQFRKVLENTP